MPWSPPKRFTVTISLLFELIGLGLALSATGILRFLPGLLESVLKISDPYLVCLLGAFLCQRVIE